MPKNTPIPADIIAITKLKIGYGTFVKMIGRSSVVWFNNYRKPEANIDPMIP